MSIAGSDTIRARCRHPFDNHDYVALVLGKFSREARTRSMFGCSLKATGMSPGLERVPGS